jgi:hypothetical protein
MLFFHNLKRKGFRKQARGLEVNEIPELKPAFLTGLF